MRPKFGVRLPVTGPLASPDSMIRIGTRADELGFDAITTHDHVVQSHSQRYHNSGGVAELVDTNEKSGLPLEVYETMVTLSVLAGRTQNVRLVPCALVLPWRHPVLLAKQMVTLHELSGGRFVCSVVIGRWKNDFEAMGSEYARRGKLMDENLETIQALTRGTPGSSERPGLVPRYPALELFPKPSKRLPIWVGGTFNDKTFERVARFGDGFVPGSISPSKFRDGLPRLSAALLANGRDTDSVEIGTQTFMSLGETSEEAQNIARHTIDSFFHGEEFSRPDPERPSRTLRDALKEEAQNASLVGSPRHVIAKVEDFVDAGVQFFDIRQVHRSTEDVLAMLKLFASEVMTSFV